MITEPRYDHLYLSSITYHLHPLRRWTLYSALGSAHGYWTYIGVPCSDDGVSAARKGSSIRLSACNFCPQRPKHEDYEFTIGVKGTFDPVGTRNSQRGTSSCLSVLPERQSDPQQTDRVMAFHASGVDAAGQLDRSVIGPVI